MRAKAKENLPYYSKISSPQAFFSKSGAPSTPFFRPSVVQTRQNKASSSPNLVDPRAYLTNKKCKPAHLNLVRNAERKAFGKIKNALRIMDKALFSHSPDRKQLQGIIRDILYMTFRDDSYWKGKVTRGDLSVLFAGWGPANTRVNCLYPGTADYKEDCENKETGDPTAVGSTLGGVRLCMPKFLSQSEEERANTLIHEVWHTILGLRHKDKPETYFQGENCLEQAEYIGSSSQKRARNADSIACFVALLNQVDESNLQSSAEKLRYRRNAVEAFAKGKDIQDYVSIDVRTGLFDSSHIDFWGLTLTKNDKSIYVDLKQKEKFAFSFWARWDLFTEGNKRLPIGYYGNHYINRKAKFIKFVPGQNNLFLPQQTQRMLRRLAAKEKTSIKIVCDLATHDPSESKRSNRHIHRLQKEIVVSYSDMF